MSTLFAEILDRMHDLRLTGDVVRLQSNFQSGIVHMPLAFRLADPR
jgi:hypothetical protein